MNKKYFTVELETREKILIAILLPEPNLVPILFLPYGMTVEKEYCEEGKYLYELRAKKEIKGKIIVGFKVKKGEEK